MRFQLRLIVLAVIALPSLCTAETTEFCLDGEFDLGARYQGMQPQGGEFWPARWCVISDDGSERVLLTISGRSNPDMDGGWSVAFLPPDLVRIVNADSPPDVEFQGADSRHEARRHRRIDPRRLVDELLANPIWLTEGMLTGHATVRYPGEAFPVHVTLRDGNLQSLRVTADLPLRGRVPVVWHWDWADESAPLLRIEVGADVIFRARGFWRALQDVAGLWQPTPGADPVDVPGANWPARIDMSLVELADRVWLVRGVRTGFQHLIVQTDDGLVVADAPAGWVELHQIPPTDLVPGLGISGLSERLIEFLQTEMSDQPIRAVALTHAHDDHAGGARPFAASGAAIYAPADVAAFLKAALNADSMPEDRLGDTDGSLRITPVSEALTLSDPSRPVVLIPIGAGPHVNASLGVHAVEQGIFFQSDLHVPRNEADSPRTDRAITECWFAGWAVANLPSETVVVNTHSHVQTPVSRLAKYLQSNVCLDAAVEP